MGTLDHVNIVSLVGKQGAGKSTVASALASYYKCLHVEASSVVRNLYGNLTRSQMPFTNSRTADEPTWLGDAIVDFTELSLNERNLTNVETIQNVLIISGVRETEVHSTLTFKHGARIIPVCLFAPAEDRFERQQRLGKLQSFSEFEAQDEAEMRIGLKNIIKFAKYHIPSNRNISQDETVARIVQIVDNEIR